MRFHHGELVRTLDARLVGTDLSCLSPTEKIAILQEIAAQSSHVVAYRSRLLEALAGSAFAEAESERVLKKYRLAGEHAWMYPVIEAIDCVGEAVIELDETMMCENEDYRAFKTRWAEEDG